AIFDPPSQAVGSVTEIGLPLLWLALLLWPLDIALRRLYVRPSDVVPGLAALRRRMGADDGATDGRDESLARPSAAKRRARTTNRAPGPEVPNLYASAIERPQPAPAPQPADAAPPAEPPTPVTAAAPADDDQFARLMAAKQRARKKRDK